MSEKEYNYYDEVDDIDEEFAIARCEECGELIYEDNGDVYIDDDGNYFCCLKCALDHYSIRRVTQYD